jgi:ArsR family transcriptional regulator
MEDKYIYNLQAEVCKALGNPIRVEAIEILRNGELCFSDILQKVGGLKSTLSQNLSIMVSAGILKVRKDSRCNYYSLTSPKVYKACQLMREVLISNLEKQNVVFTKIKAEL